MPRAPCAPGPPRIPQSAHPGAQFPPTPCNLTCTNPAANHPRQDEDGGLPDHLKTLVPTIEKFDSNKVVGWVEKNWGTIVRVEAPVGLGETLAQAIVTGRMSVEQTGSGPALSVNINLRVMKEVQETYGFTVFRPMVYGPSDPRYKRLDGFKENATFAQGPMAAKVARAKVMEGQMSAASPAFRRHTGRPTSAGGRSSSRVGRKRSLDLNDKSKDGGGGGRATGLTPILGNLGVGGKGREISDEDGAEDMDEEESDEGEEKADMEVEVTPEEIIKKVAADRKARRSAGMTMEAYNKANENKAKKKKGATESGRYMDNNEIVALLLQDADLGDRTPTIRGIEDGGATLTVLFDDPNDARAVADTFGETWNSELLQKGAAGLNIVEGKEDKSIVVGGDSIAFDQVVKVLNSSNCYSVYSSNEDSSTEVADYGINDIRHYHAMLRISTALQAKGIYVTQAIYRGRRDYTKSFKQGDTVSSLEHRYRGEECLFVRVAGSLVDIQKMHDDKNMPIDKTYFSEAMLATALTWEDVQKKKRAEGNTSGQLPWNRKSVV